LFLIIGFIGYQANDSLVCQPINQSLLAPEVLINNGLLQQAISAMTNQQNTGNFKQIIQPLIKDVLDGKIDISNINSVDLLPLIASDEAIQAHISRLAADGNPDTIVAFESAKGLFRQVMAFHESYEMYKMKYDLNIEESEQTRLPALAHDEARQAELVLTSVLWRENFGINIDSKWMAFSHPIDTLSRFVNFIPISEADHHKMIQDLLQVDMQTVNMQDILSIAEVFFKSSFISDESQQELFQKLLVAKFVFAKLHAEFRQTEFFNVIGENIFNTLLLRIVNEFASIPQSEIKQAGFAGLEQSAREVLNSLNNEMFLRRTKFMASNNAPTSLSFSAQEDEKSFDWVINFPVGSDARQLKQLIALKISSRIKANLRTQDIAQINAIFREGSLGNEAVSFLSASESLEESI